MAGTSGLGSTIEDKLDREVDVLSLVSSILDSLDLDPVAQDTDGRLRPARATVLGNMLVQGLSDIGSVVHVGPIPLLRKVVCRGVSVRQRSLNSHFWIWELLEFRHIGRSYGQYAA
jgi:hypothetical protein